MKILRAYRYKLEPSTKQEVILWAWLSHLRCLYNIALDQRIRNYQQFGKSINYYDQANELIKLKKEFSWFAEVPAQCLQQKLKDLDSAYQRFFKHGAGYPKFQKRGQRESLRFADLKAVKISYRKGKRTSYVKLPKIGFVKFVSHEKMVGELKNCSITKQADGFYISFQVEYEHEVKKNLSNPVGIDRGIKNLATTSNGEFINTPIEKIKKLEKQLGKQQKKLSKKKKGSNNFKKQAKKVARIHLKIKNIRKDTIHKITTELAKNHGVVVIEDLKIQNMTASASGTIEDPGTNIAQKSGLNRSILRMGWGEFERQLKYKLEWSGGQLIKINPAYTSQTCNKCGHVDKNNRKDEDFKCLSCGYEGNADVNAAINILRIGQDMSDFMSVEVCSNTGLGSRNPWRDLQSPKSSF